MPRWCVSRRFNDLHAIDATPAPSYWLIRAQVRVLTELRAKQQTEGPTWGIDGTTGKVADMNAKDGPRIWEPYAVKVQTVKTAIEAASLILRVDDIVSGIKGQK